VPQLAAKSHCVGIHFDAADFSDWDEDNPIGEVRQLIAWYPTSSRTASGSHAGACAAV
jgi:hypothetical protein